MNYFNWEMRIVIISFYKRLVIFRNIKISYGQSNFRVGTTSNLNGATFNFRVSEMNLVVDGTQSFRTLIYFEDFTLILTR